MDLGGVGSFPTGVGYGVAAAERFGRWTCALVMRQPFFIWNKHVTLFCQGASYVALPASPLRARDHLALRVAGRAWFSAAVVAGSRRQYCPLPRDLRPCLAGHINDPVAGGRLGATIAAEAARPVSAGDSA
jgi:hypothetical protein